MLLNKSMNLVAVVLALFMGIAMFFGNTRDAYAEDEWVLTSGVSFLYFYDNVISDEYRDSNNYYGGLVEMQGEYRFTDWFGLGLEVGLGGMVDRDASTNWSVPHHAEVFYFQGLITCKFIADLDIVELWGEVGVGAGVMVGNYIDSDGYVTDEPNVLMPVRIRLGATFDINDSMGLGVHGSYGDGVLFFPGFPLVEAGVHFVKKF